MNSDKFERFYKKLHPNAVRLTCVDDGDNVIVHYYFTEEHCKKFGKNHINTSAEFLIQSLN